MEHYSDNSPTPFYVRDRPPLSINKNHSKCKFSEMSPLMHIDNDSFIQRILQSSFRGGSSIILDISVVHGKKTEQQKTEQQLTKRTKKTKTIVSHDGLAFNVHLYPLLLKTKLSLLHIKYISCKKYYSSSTTASNNAAITSLFLFLSLILLFSSTTCKSSTGI